MSLTLSSVLCPLSTNIRVNMEVVFSNNDIAKQLPQDSKRFAGVDKSYMKLMHKAFEISNVVLCCHGHEPMKTVLPNLAAQLDMCQKSLNGYFESKRLLFPRFFFISDSLLLELLSEGSEPQKIIGSIGMLFDSLVNVVFDENDSHVMTTMISDEGEHVKLSTPLLCDGMAEEYLEKLVVSMRTTIRDISRECAHDLFVFDTGLMEHLFRGFPGQVCLIGLQIYWTNFAEEALLKTKQDKLIMSNTAKKFDADLKELLSLVKKDLGPSQRISLESMITVQMFQKETFDDLVKAKIKDVNDFEWQKQARSIWKSEDHQDSLVIHMMDTSIMYKNEFFGCKERLVMTALTTRCYLTIFQALSMHLGVAHFGPAGTGKTMAIQDLGRTLGKYVVVFNCSNQLGISALGKILKGVAMTGSWGCFDDLSRVDLDAISVAAQQMSTILFAKRAKAKNFVFTDGDNGTLDANAAYFMTLLPSPENTLALPENMKTQVRGIMMLTPDPVTIVRCKLSAAGYLEASKICSKLDTLYDMCSRCLSKQPHYDFGLRNLCSLVMVCGRTKRSIADPDVSESQMVVQALKETNLACLTQEDSIIFIDFLNTLFPGVSGEKLENVKQSGIMRRSCDSLHLEYDSISAIRWVEKLTHFHEICQVRHGVGLVGPTGGGKSTILQTSIQTFGEMEGVVQSVKTLNPKAVDLSQVFGYFDMTKSKWSEGIFSTLWRKAAQTPTCSNWIVFDGPVDLDWMENLNTALDDTKVLTLANGDRLPVPDRFRIVLETDDLVHASPAAVSRIGIIFVSSATLGYEPVVSSWLKSRPEPQRALLEEIFAKSFSTIVNVASRILKTVMDVPSICLVQNMLRYLEALLSRGKGSEKGDQTQPVLERMIVYSFCWSFGGPVENEGRGRLEVELKKVLPTGFPAADLGKPFDCYLDDKSDWKQASKIQLVWEFPIGADFWDIYVPTTHNEQYRMHLELLAPQKIPVLLLGGVGTGKTSMILQFMRDRATNDGLTLKRTVLSADTSPSALQRAIESATEKRQGRIYGPSNYRTCSVLIDDVNMPRLSNWGDQPTSELLRQLISEKGFFNLDKPGEWKIIKDLEYFAAMTHPGGGRHDVPARLKRRMVLMNLTAPPRAALDRIYSEMVRGYFSEKNVGSDTASVASKLAEPTINIWSTLQERITPTATKFHCNFTLHDLSHVFRGMVRCHPDTFDGKDYVARLWKHECERAFTDKLSSLADTVMASALITEALDEALGKLASKCHATSYFCPFMQNEEDRLLADGGIDPDALFQPYEICQSFEEIQRRVQTFLHKYNHDPEIPHKMDLVLFQYAVEYLLKIVRGICFDGGSCLLIGLKASGKQSLATLALYILDHQVLRIRHSRRSSRCTKVTLLEDLNSHCKSAALHDQHFTFLLTEADMIEESFLDLVNQLIFTGEITDMFTKDEMSIMVGEASFRAEVQKHMPEWSESTENLTKFFIRRVRRNFHCIMCFSPSDPKLMTRVRCYPALMGSCHLIWFTVWPAEGLQKVAEHSFLKNKIKMQHKEQILKHIPEVQDLAQATALDYLKEFGQKVHVTPMTYLLFLETYAHVFLQKDAELHLAIRKFKKGLHKLEQVGEDVEEMLADIEQSEQFLQKAQFDSGNLLKDITNQQSVAERKKKVLEEAHVALAAVEAVVLEERNGIQKELVVAEPYLKRAEEGLNSISPKDLQTLKALKNPPAAVKVILDSVLILLKKPLNPIKIAEEKGVQYYKDSYATALGMMNDGTFVDVAQNYPRDSINDESIELLQPYLDNALFNPDVARKASAMAAGLCTWVQSLDQYYTFARIVKPRRNLLFDKEVELAHAQRRYESVESDLNRVRDEIEEMQRNLREAVNEKNSLQSETEITREKVKAANTLIRALAGEKTRWMASAGDYQLRLAALPGDVSVAACFLTYCGPLSKHLRQDLCTNVKADLRVKGLPKYENFDLTELLSTEGERGDWTMQSLPGDHFSIENGILVTKALRWPLLIDPEGQGLEWIYRKEKDNMLKTTTFGDNHFLHIYEECITHGRPMLIENVNDKLDPIVESILKQRYALTAGPEREMSIKIGDKDLDVAAGFALYLMTKLPNPDLSPDMASQVTVINFKISIESLQDQLFVQIVQKERPEFQAQRNFTVGEVHTLRKNTADLDADILTRIYNISEAGSILDDVGLIEVLEKVKEIDRMVKEKEKIVDGLSKKIDQSCTELRSVAKRASALYSVMLDFAHVNTMYKTSLQQFKGIFKDSVMNAPKENNIQLKVQGINTELTWMFFKSIRRGIMEQDKELFALMIGLKIIQFDGSITVPHLQCFIEGGYGLDADQVRPKPYNWLAVDSWLNVMAIFNMFPVLKDLPDSIQHLGDQWRSWYDYPTPELHKLPDIPSAFDKITPFLQLLIVRAMRPDRTMAAALGFIKEVLGENYIGHPACDLEAVYQSSAARTPLIVLLSPGADPTGRILALGRKLKKEVLSVSMGQGQDVVARRHFDTGIQIGSWVLLQNVHLDVKFLYELEQNFYKVESIESDFRMFMTTEVTPAFPVGLLQMSIKMSNEAPTGVKAGLRRLYSLINQDMIEAVPRVEWRSLLFSLSFMHSVMLARRRFVQCGWSTPCDFSHADFICCATFLQRHVREIETKQRKEIHWETLRTMIVQVLYGGDRSDESDLRLMRTLSEKYISPLVLETNFQFALGYPMPGSSSGSADLTSFRASIEAYPAIEKPEILGLSSTSEFVVGLQNAQDVFKKLGNTMTSGDQRGPEKVPEAAVLPRIEELLQKLPYPFGPAEIRESLAKDGGAELPTNVAFKHELDVLNKVINTARNMLQRIHVMLSGLVTQSDELNQAVQDIYFSRVPRSWEDLSWQSPNLGHWIQQLQNRLEQWKRWLERGRPFSFWLAGFVNPTGFLSVSLVCFCVGIICLFLRRHSSCASRCIVFRFPSVCCLSGCLLFYSSYSSYSSPPSHFPTL